MSGDAPHSAGGAEPAAVGRIEQDQTPYLDAIVEYAKRRPGRFHVPGHKGGQGADPAAIEALGRAAFDRDIPAGIEGIDVGPESPFQRAQRLAADAWGARRSWFLINGASQGNHATCLALRHHGRSVVVQRNAHSSTIDGIILAGLEPTFVAPEIDAELGVAHCLSPESLAEALDRSPGAVAALTVSPTYFGAVADIAGMSKVCRDRGLPLIVDEAWGSHLRFSPLLPAERPGVRRRPGPLLGAQAARQPDPVRDPPPGPVRRARRGPGRPLRDPDRVDQPERAAHRLVGRHPPICGGARTGAARRNPGRTRAGPGRGPPDTGARRPRRAIGRSSGGLELGPVAPLDRRPRHGQHRQAARLPDAGSGRHQPRAGFRERRGRRLWDGRGRHRSAARLVAALRRAVDALGADAELPKRPFTPPPPWGSLEAPPREAFFGPQEVVPFDQAVGRVAAESLAAYPPGIPNVLPGERLTQETLAYIREVVEHGGWVRGAVDRSLRTIRVVSE